MSPYERRGRRRSQSTVKRESRSSHKWSNAQKVTRSQGRRQTEGRLPALLGTRSVDTCTSIFVCLVSDDPLRVGEGTGTVSQCQPTTVVFLKVLASIVMNDPILERLLIRLLKDKEKRECSRHKLHMPALVSAHRHQRKRSESRYERYRS